MSGENVEPVSSESESPLPRRRRGGWLIAACKIFTALLLVIVVAWGVWRWKQAHDVAEELAAIRAAGYPATPAELDAWYPHVPDDQNAALGIVAAAGELKMPADPSEVPYVGSAGGHGLGERMGPEMRRAAGELLRENAAVLAKVRSALRRAKSRYPTDLSYPGGVLHGMSRLRSLALLLQLQAIVAAEDGRSDDAVDAIVTGFALPRVLEDEPVMASRLICVSLECLPVTTLEHAVNLTKLSPAGLQRLEDTLAREYQPEGFARGMIGDRACIVWRMHNNVPLQPGAWYEWKRTAERFSGVLDWRCAKLLPVVGEGVAAASLSPMERCRRYGEIAAEVGKGGEVAAYASVMARENTADVRTAAWLAAARAAVLVCQWRQQGGTLPQNFSGFSGEVRKRWPEDPLAGTPIRYLRKTRGFVVYSIGDDFVDDGGAPIWETDRGDVPFRVLR